MLSLPCVSLHVSAGLLPQLYALIAQESVPVGRGQADAENQSGRPSVLAPIRRLRYPTMVKIGPQLYVPQQLLQEVGKLIGLSRVSW